MYFLPVSLEIDFSLHNHHLFHNFIRQEHSVHPHIKVRPFSKATGTTVLRNHLASEHVASWVDTCDKFKIPIKAQVAQKAVNDYRQKRGQPQAPSNGSQVPPPPIREYSREAFVDAIVEWIVADDQVCLLSLFHIINLLNYYSQSLNVIENPHLRAIFLMLREELCDEDIPRRTHIRQRVGEIWEDHISDLEIEMNV